MKRHSSGFIIGVVVTIILGFAVIAGVWLALSSTRALGYEPDSLQATKTGPNSATLNLGTYPDSHVCHPNAVPPQSGWVSYCNSTSLVVPPNSTVTIVISQYDSASGLVNDYFSHVRGTVGGVAMYNGRAMTQINPDDAAHTFTIQTRPDSPNPLFVSVPLIGVSSNANPNAVNVKGTDGSENPYPKPNIISFQIQTGPAGTIYIWHCYVPCGSAGGPPYGFSGPMSTTGFMAGTLTVANY